MIGLVPRYACERCTVVVDGDPSWRHGITPPTTDPAVFPSGSTMRWLHVKGARSGGYLWWCASCTIALGGPEYEAAKGARAAVTRARYAIGNAAMTVAMAALPEDPPHPNDPFTVPI